MSHRPYHDPAAGRREAVIPIRIPVYVKRVHKQPIGRPGIGGRFALNRLYRIYENAADAQLREAVSSHFLAGFHGLLIRAKDLIVLIGRTWLVEHVAAEVESLGVEANLGVVGSVR